jgi:hypothetical protein
MLTEVIDDDAEVGVEDIVVDDNVVSTQENESSAPSTTNRSPGAVDHSVVDVNNTQYVKATENIRNETQEMKTSDLALVLSRARAKN